MAAPILTFTHMTIKSIPLQTLDVGREYLQRSGDWPGPGACSELTGALFGPAIRNLTAVGHELQR